MASFASQGVASLRERAALLVSQLPASVAEEDDSVAFLRLSEPPSTISIDSLAVPNGYGYAPLEVDGSGK